MCVSARGFISVSLFILVKFLVFELHDLDYITLLANYTVLIQGCIANFGRQTKNPYFRSLRQFLFCWGLNEQKRSRYLQEMLFHAKSLTRYTLYIPWFSSDTIDFGFMQLKLQLHLYGPYLYKVFQSVQKCNCCCEVAIIEISPLSLLI